MANLKVTVTGMVIDTFIGNDKEVEAYLLNLKAIQDQKVSSEDMKAYRKEMPKFRESHLIGREYCKYNQHAQQYRSPSPELINFREKTKPYGLTIKIEPHISKTDKFF